MQIINDPEKRAVQDVNQLHNQSIERFVDVLCRDYESRASSQ